MRTWGSPSSPSSIFVTSPTWTPPACTLPPSTSPWTWSKTAFTSYEPRRARDDERHGDDAEHEGDHSEDGCVRHCRRQPTGIRGFADQKISVPTMLISVTPMMLTAIERAVAVPTSTGPPRTL